MYFAIEVAALMLLVCCTVQLRRLSRRLIDERDRALHEQDRATKSAIKLAKELDFTEKDLHVTTREREDARAQYLEQKQTAERWRQQAEAFEDTAKKHEAQVRAQAETIESLMDAAHTMEEHIAAERARGDKLAAALQVAEDKAKKLTQEAKEAREQTVKLRQQLSQPQNPQWTRVTDTSAESLRAAIAPGNPMDSFAREMANIFAYNGTADGQEELSDG